MSNLISKKELYRKLGEAYNKGYLTWGANEIIRDIIGECDSVENKGEWIESDIPESMLHKCSKCGYQLGAYSFNYCPMCGREMLRGKADDLSGL